MTPLDAIKATGGPGSFAFFVVVAGLALAVAYRWPRARCAARIAMCALTGAYLTLAIPVVANAIASRLPQPSAPPDLSNVQAIDTIVVFDGDNRRGRARATVNVWRAATAARIVVSGEEWLLKPLLEAGIPPDRIARETVSQNTREQIAWVKHYVRQRPRQSVAVVASQLQMPRVEALARRARLSARLVTSPVDDVPASVGPWRIVPTYLALRISRDAIYEHAALAYYRWRGWIDESPHSVGSRRQETARQSVVERTSQ